MINTLMPSSETKMAFCISSTVTDFGQMLFFFLDQITGKILVSNLSAVSVGIFFHALSEDISQSVLWYWMCSPLCVGAPSD